MSGESRRKGRPIFFLFGPIPRGNAGVSPVGAQLRMPLTAPLGGQGDTSEARPVLQPVWGFWTIRPFPPCIPRPECLSRSPRKVSQCITSQSRHNIAGPMPVLAREIFQSERIPVRADLPLEWASLTRQSTGAFYSGDGIHSGRIFVNSVGQWLARFPWR